MSMSSSADLHFNPRPRVGGDFYGFPDRVRPAISIHAPAWGATRADRCRCGRMGISIHAPAWGATIAIAAAVLLHPLFQSTPPRGGRPSPSNLCRRTRSFQSTPPRGGRPRKLLSVLGIVHFNPRPRVGGDEKRYPQYKDEFTFQSTPPRGGRHRGRGCWRAHRAISIHAPAWGATAGIQRLSRRAKFQSTPPRGGRHITSATSAGVTNFNPRPRVGGDSQTGWSGYRWLYFNPRPRVGGDSRAASSRFDCLRLFQSTPPRGGRPRSPPAAPPAHTHFNPRPRVGGDPAGGHGHAESCISIHAPAWGATACVRWAAGWSDFNPRPRVGGDERLIDIELPIHISIHAPAWGATSTVLTRCGTIYFNPRPRVGGDCNPATARPFHHISIHAPAWGATVCPFRPGVGQVFQSTPPRGGRRC